MNLSVCLYTHIPKPTLQNFTKNPVYVASGRGSVLVWGGIVIFMYLCIKYGYFHNI